MAHCLAFYCDTPHTQQLMGMFGDRLQRLGQSDLLYFVNVFTAAWIEGCDYAIKQYVADTDLVTTEDLDSILEILDGFDSRMNSALLFGLAACLADRGEGQ